jgi:hypothetical protein
MGAAAAVEGRKPVDASDIVASGSLDVAKNEIIMLRTTLGKYAAQAGFTEDLALDASDLVKGMNEEADFDRCVAEIRHIRECLRLSTQNARRKTRAVVTNVDFGDEKKGDREEDDREDDDYSDDDYTRSGRSKKEDMDGRK